ncbi:hypothetical protein JW964_15335 [candidate division KSB1 bacterium]|nr:hypothetical protein [candidate division KSB1 bacterium]
MRISNFGLRISPAGGLVEIGELPDAKECPQAAEEVQEKPPAGLIKNSVYT